jgi:hypothetical protein
MKQVRLNFRVSDKAGGAFLSNARIEIRDGSGPIFLNADRYGTATVLLAPHRYTISVGAKGFRSSGIRAIDVESGQTLDYELEVLPTDDPEPVRGDEVYKLSTETAEVSATLESVPLENLYPLPSIPLKITPAHRRWRR